MTRARDVATQGGLVLIASANIGSTVSSVTINNCFSSTYENYLITVTRGVSSTITDLKLQIGSATTQYYGSRSKVTFGGSLTTDADYNTSSFTFAGRGTPNYLSMYAFVASPNIADETIIYAQNVGVSGTDYAIYYAGFLNDTTQHTSFTVIPNSGTISGGVVRVYGYK